MGYKICTCVSVLSVGSKCPRVLFIEKVLENPNEYVNIMCWMIKHGFGDDEIGKVVGGNAVKLFERVW